jgi:predicted Zn-dependent protease
VVGVCDGDECRAHFAGGCETNPYTGRSQLLMTSVSQEMQMGAQAYAQVKSDPKMRPSQDPHEIEPVKRVASRIVRGREAVKVCRDCAEVSVGSDGHQG